MTSVDYTLLFEPTIVLSLHRTPTGWFGVTDQHGRLWFPPTEDVTVCLRFLQAAVEKGHAVIDDASVERVTWAAAHSVKVPDAPSNVIPIGRKTA